MFNNDSFGDRLKELRKSKKLTQVQVSEMIGVQQGTYSRWENGTLEPNLEAVVKLAKLFDTTTDYLLGKTIYSTLDVIPHPITRIDMKKLKEFNKTELNDLKFAIVMNGIKNYSTLPKYLDELVSENNLDEEEQEILHTLFKEVYDYFNAD
ncbi:helix-turn-helix domain-containing protein [Streptococcus gordonii]|uniref:helix-turn-helix domain-containing protein n=1 Tax=Streptococcus gordonii TaxID=1302 RepID=UPI000779E2A5|nr:helix-turn-helix transcriptional regulator [Streptococcus gordonii]